MGNPGWKHPSASEVDLGAFSSEAQEGPDDPAEAAKHFRKAADRGDPRGQFVLGLMHADGNGVPQDDVAAYMWAELAAARTTGELHQRAMKLLDHLSLRMDEAAMSKAQELARQWRLKEHDD